MVTTIPRPDVPRELLLVQVAFGNQQLPEGPQSLWVSVDDNDSSVIVLRMLDYKLSLLTREYDAFLWHDALWGRTNQLRHSRPLASDLPTEVLIGCCLERLVRILFHSQVMGRASRTAR